MLRNLVVVLPLVVACESPSPSLAPAPRFPGAGTSGADQPLPGAVMNCFFGDDDESTPAATIEHVLEVFEGIETVHLRLTLDPDFVDNTYGANAIGWDEHAFRQLVGSDHAELFLADADGQLAVQFKIDYLSADGDGYRSFGVSDKDGKMIHGDAADILAYSTSMDRNFNERGYDEYTVDSPATDADYTPNPAAPAWDFRVVYEAWVANAAFGGAGFGSARVESIHASPSKVEDNTIVVYPDPCPPDWDPDPPQCHEDVDCPTGEFCNEQGHCDPPQCHEDVDCPTGEFCNEQGHCEPPEPECLEDADCGEYEVCTNGVCVPYVP